jgi:hypothetical protein
LRWQHRGTDGSKRELKGHSGVQEAACRALANLMVNAENEARLARTGGIEALISAMRAREGHAGGQEAACRAPANFSPSAESQEEVACAGGIQALISAMRAREGHAGLQFRACFGSWYHR